MYILKLSNIKQLIALVFIMSFTFLISCNQVDRGFVLPKGDLASGKIGFVSMSCNECHSTSDIEWIGNDKDIHIKLGGDVSVVKTYDELVTSVINPTHKISKQYTDKLEKGESSPMYNYNELITVKELIDVVTYLQSEYDIVTPDILYFPY
jgi:hypothetical protein